MKKDIIMSDSQRKKLLNHPRMVELYIIMTYDLFFSILGDEATLSLFKAICSSNTIDYDRIRLLLSRYPIVKSLQRTDENRYYKELAVLAATHGKTRYWLAAKWLKVSKATVYTKTDKLLLEDVTSDEFLDSMNKEVTLSASKDIYRELVHFQDALRLLAKVYE